MRYAKHISTRQQKHKSKRRYRLRNWSEYNEALKRRGALDVWIDEGIQEKWYAKPTGKNARMWPHGNSRTKPHPRDENLRDIRSTSRKRWKESVNYHIRSLVESAIFRFKCIFGDKLHARKLYQQKTEVSIKVAILNLMMRLGMPQSYAVA